MNANYTLADLLQLLGAKELELFLLKRHVATLEEALRVAAAGASVPPEPV